MHATNAPFHLESDQLVASATQIHTLGRVYSISPETFAGHYAVANALSASLTATAVADLSDGNFIPVEVKYVKNSSGATILRSAATVNLATQNNVSTASAAILDNYAVAGFALTEIANGSYGWIVISGRTYAIGDGTAVNVGDLLSTSAAIAGDVEPTTAATGVTLGRATKAIAATAGLYTVLDFRVPN